MVQKSKYNKEKNSYIIKYKNKIITEINMKNIKDTLLQNYIINKKEKLEPQDMTFEISNNY